MGFKFAGFLVLDQQEASAFAARVAKLLERVEYRRADTPEDKEAIFRLRYEAYARDGFIEPDASGLFSDPADDSPNVWLIGVYIDGVLASSIRLHIASRPHQFLPETKAFPDIVGPHLEVGDLMIDASRQTSRFEFTRAYAFLPYITMRSAFLAEDHFGADYILAASRPEYQAAFRRMFGSVNWAAPRPYLPLNRRHALIAYDCRALRQKTRTRYPFMESTIEERRRLFARSSNVDSDPYEEITAGRRARCADGKQHSTTYAA